MAGLDLFTLHAGFLPSTEATQSSKTVSKEPDEARYPKRKRPEIKYFHADEADEAGDSTDSETECIPIKRAKPTRSKKPLPPQKIFPFTSLPAELRNRIYELCFPDMPTISEEAKGAQGTIWFRSKQIAYRRSVEQYLPSEEDLQLWGDGSTHGRRHYQRRNYRGTQRPHQVQHGDEDDEEVAGKSVDKKLGMNLLALNQAIYNEAAPMVYRQRLIFTDTVALLAFASTLSPRTAKLIRSIEILDWNLTRSRKSMGFTAMTMLAAKGVTNLEKLRISCLVGSFWSWRRSNGEQADGVPKRVARKVYRDCFLWLETVGRAKLLEDASRWAGIDVLEISDENYREALQAGKSEKDAFEEADIKFRKELKRLLRPALG